MAIIEPCTFSISEVQLYFIVDATGEPKKPKKRKSVTIHSYTRAEEDELRKLFPKCFKSGKLPGLKDIAIKVNQSSLLKDIQVSHSSIKNKIDRMFKNNQ